MVSFERCQSVFTPAEWIDISLIIAEESDDWNFALDVRDHIMTRYYDLQLDVYSKRGDIRYYRQQDRKTSEAYKKGRQMEYRTMATLRNRGWHCMRRFGSKGVHFCSKCMRHVRINHKYCSHCKTDEYIRSASLDVTAYRNGIYLLISCKWSKNGTVFMDDPTYPNLLIYARHYNAKAIFAGVTQKGKIYLLDLETKKVYEEWK